MTAPSRHPGPPLSDPHVALACTATPVRIPLAAGDVLLPALSRALEAMGADGAWLTIRGAPLAALDYVGPDWPDPQGLRAAWYSETRSLTAPATLHAMGLVTGVRSGAPFLHGHGTWSGADGAEVFGHVLPDRCAFAGPAVAEGWRIDGATLDTRPCPETGFDLFHPVATTAAPATRNARLVKLSPGADVIATLGAIRAEAGFRRAAVFGLGSLIRARFADGRHLDSRATEFLIREATVSRDGSCTVDIRIVGTEGRIADGTLGPDNPVLVTAEMLMIESA